MNESEHQAEKIKWIEKLRSVGFNCFPIPKGKKSADGRYKAETTLPNQIIRDDENFGYIAIRGAGTLTVDFDHETLFDKVIDKIKAKYVVFKSPHGYHVPVTGMSGQIEKIELFDYSIRPTKLVEIQGPKHYCVGVGSMVIGDKKHNDEGSEL